MKAGIHPTYEAIEATRSCGNVTKTRSTLCKPIHLNACPGCHPSYTGKQKVPDTGDCIDHFKQRSGVLGATK